MNRRHGAESRRSVFRAIGMILSISFVLSIAAVLFFSCRRIERILTECSNREIREIRALEEAQDEDSGVGKEAFLRLESLLADLRENQERLESRMDAYLTVRESPAVGNPDALRAHEYAEFGDFCAESGNDNEAARYYRESLGCDRSTEVLFSYAESLYRADPHLRDNGELIHSLKEVLKKEPFHGGALSLLGKVSLENGDVPTASEAYEALYDLKPGDENIASVYGRLLMRQGRFGEAIEPLAAAAGPEREDPSVPCDLGHCLAALGRHEEAAESFDHSIRLDAFYPPAHLGKAESLLALGFGSEAAQSAAAYCELRDGDFRGRLIEGDAYASAGERIKAEMAWSSALETLELNSREDVEKMVTATVRLSGSLLERGRTRAALARSAAVLEFAESPEILEYAFRAAEELGDEDIAGEYAKRLEKVREVALRGAGSLP